MKKFPHAVEVDGAPMLRYEPGWTGGFTREQAKDAWPNGSRVVKAQSEPKDTTPDGTPGVILGSMSHPSIRNGEVCYFVEWADKPKVAVAVMAFKLRLAAV